MHESDGAWKRFTLGPLGLVASLVILAVSCSMNFKFGYSLGKSPTDAFIYGWASVGADVLKAIAPFFFFTAVAARRKAVAVASVLVWVIMTAYGLTSAAGHAALNRLDTTGQRAVAADSYKDTRSDLADARKALGFIPAHRGESAVRAELEKLKTNRAWSQTNECSEPNGKAARAFCAEYQTLRAELGNAENASKLTARIDTLTAKLDKVAEGGGAVLSEADPQASILARLSRQDVPTVQLALAILIVLMLEIGGGLGPYASLWYMTGGPVRVLDLKADDAAPSAAPAATAVALATVPAPLALTGPGVGALPLPEASTAAESPPIPLVANDLGKPSAGPPEPAPAPQPEPNPFLDGKPLSGSEAALRSINFPFEARPTGQQRAKDAPKIAAKRFAMVCQAYGQTGAFWADELQKLYRQFCIADHRDATSMRDVYSALQNHTSSMVEYGKVRINPDSDNKAARYTIKPARYSRPKPEPDKTPPAAPQEVGEGKRGPFPSAPSLEAANDAAPLKVKPVLPVVPTRSFLPEHERWEIAMARVPKAEFAGARNRKQRGSRTHRFMRAA